MEDFVHLHVHSQYSILDGQAAITRLVDKAIANGMRGMALTDHGNMMGIKELFDYSSKVRSKGKDAVAKAQEKLALLESGTFQPEPGSSDEGKSTDDLIAATKKQIEKQQIAANFMPILGCEMYVARRGDKSLREGRIDQSGWHLIVLAKNEKGYHNLIKLVSRSWVDGKYMRPRTDPHDLEHYREGLIICSACLGGEVPQKIMNGTPEEVEAAILWYKRVFGDDYYLELQRHEVKDPAIRANRETFPLQQKVNAELIRLSAKLGVKLVCTNDCHFVDEENGEAHDRLICLATGKDLDDPTRMLYTKQEWFKTREEMNEVFADVPEALANTCEVLSKVEFYSIDHPPIMPNFAIPEDFGTEEEYRQRLTEEDLFNEFTRDVNGQVVLSQEEAEKKIKKLGGYDKLYRIKLEADYLAKLAYEGAKKRYGDPLDDETAERIKFELYIMKTMGFPGYFLIVQDYIRAAREELDVSVGPGRGSAAGSAVAYCLGITQIDPIKYDLLFERFLNPDRISLPDIDVDFDDDGRGRVFDWVTEKYHPANCAHIITYGTMATKMALKDVARVQKLPISVSNQLCKAIPDKLPDGPDGKATKMNLPNAIKYVPELREAEASTDPVLHDTIKYAKMLEGNVRNTGVHACGFIICRDEISDWVPVSTAEDKATGKMVVCTQYEGRVIEETGLIKMDFLGLKTLSIIKEALENIHDSLGIDINIDEIAIDDPATFQLYCDGNTVGTFQFESTGMQKHLVELQPTTFEDLIAMNALYRPGPMAYIPQFIARKHGREPITYDLPCMERYLKDTYGITIYQEQVMLLSREIANFTRGESDTLRKAMGKKLIEKLNHLHPKFIAGGKANGYDEKILEKIWADWSAFASYAFNKSHATCYSWVSYQTAYLKANFPAQYMAGVMSRSLDDIKTITKIMDECKQLGLKLLGPDVNESKSKFGVNSHGEIRFGMAAIKGVGEGAARSIIEEREKNGPYTSTFDFMERTNFKACNKKAVESLAIAGAFDAFQDVTREEFLSKCDSGLTYLDELVTYGINVQNDKLSQENNLFGSLFASDDDAMKIPHPKAPKNCERWSNLQRLERERELVGVYISGHPLDEYSMILTDFCTMPAAALTDPTPYLNQEIRCGGIVSSVRETQSKRDGMPGAFIRIDDFAGSGEFSLWGDDWAKWRGYMAVGNSICVFGRVQTRFNSGYVKFFVDKVEFLADVKDQVLRSITIHIDADQLTEEAVNDLKSILDSELEGNADVKFCVRATGQRAPITLKSRNLHITVSKKLLDFINDNEAFKYEFN